MESIRIEFASHVVQRSVFIGIFESNVLFVFRYFKIRYIVLNRFPLCKSFMNVQQELSGIKIESIKLF